jgi:hypothetical protein
MGASPTEARSKKEEGRKKAGYAELPPSGF